MCYPFPIPFHPFFPTHNAIDFQDLPIAEWLIENCATMGMTKATNVQLEAIPHILDGKDVVCRAKTGSGKTAAFALPILHHLSQDPYGTFDDDPKITNLTNSVSLCT